MYISVLCLCKSMFSVQVFMIAAILFEISDDHPFFPFCSYDDFQLFQSGISNLRPGLTPGSGITPFHGNSTSMLSSVTFVITLAFFVIFPIYRRNTIFHCATNF